jgi:hypothetical protein
LNGHSAADSEGLDLSCNFGSREAAHLRWTACLRAHMDFIQTDHYEDLARFIRKNK